MVTCSAINCGNSSTKKSVLEVKGWHKVPTDRKLRKQWIKSMRRDTPYPSDENFVLCGLHFNDENFEHDFAVSISSLAVIYNYTGVL